MSSPKCVSTRRAWYNSQCRPEPGYINGAAPFPSRWLFLRSNKMQHIPDLVLLGVNALLFGRGWEGFKTILYKYWIPKIRDFLDKLVIKWTPIILEVVSHYARRYRSNRMIHIQQLFREFARALNKFWLVENWFLDTRSSGSRYITVERFSTNQNPGHRISPSVWLVENRSTVWCTCCRWTLYPKINFQPIRACLTHTQFRGITVGHVSFRWTCIALHSVSLSNYIFGSHSENQRLMWPFPTPRPFWN